MKTNKSWLWVACLLSIAAYGCESDSVGSTHNIIRDICGNAIVETGELCDDGNRSGGDGCSADCKAIENGYECPAKGGACKPVDTPPGPVDVDCGNGVVDEGELCDDGNDLSGDGCSSECQIESGYECTAPGQPCEKLPVIDVPCGNGQIDEKEECDDGNALDGDGCSSTCTVENGWECESQDCHTVCGDGVIAGQEVCDDWNTTDGDGCSADCMTIEEGYTCIEELGYSFCVTEGCGNGQLEEGELCDDGETSGQQDYTSYGWDETNGKPYCFMCKYSDFCGDGKVSGSEQCDEGKLDDEGHPLLIAEGSNLPIGGDGSYGHCKPDCTWAERCGDGVVQEGEACDKGKDNNGSYGGCTSDCKLAPYCGDGIVQENEVCDEGIASNTGLYGHCKVDCSGIAGFCGDGEKNGQELCDNGVNNGKVTYDGCTTECKFTSICGDGTVDGANGEECDEGMLDDNGRPTLVNASGVPIGGYGNYGGCSEGCVKSAYCGDGIKNGKEKCDDGNTDPDDGCEANCMAITPKWECVEGAGGKSICSRIPCGNGTLDAGEQCDDGLNPAECLYCKVRAGYMCLNVAPACPKCTGSDATACCSETEYCRPISDLYGDGIVSSDFEKCDDGNTIDNDGCTQGKVDPGYACLTAGERCVPKACGDGIKANGEECDDGNNTDGDGCTARCKREEGYRCDTPGSPCVPGTCGDGIVQYGEECDSANGVGCTDCKIDYDYECMTDGGACQKVTCGDGNAIASTGYTSYKECDDGDNDNGDGCSSTCKIEDGYHCETVGTTSVCSEGSCGNGILDGGEECDDGNNDPADGCDPACMRESIFECNEFGCQPICGDGLVIPDIEECDDGNLVSGDGCSSTCKIENGFECVVKTSGTPDVLELPIVYHDFIRWQTHTASTPGQDGYVSQELYDSLPSDCKPGGAGATYRYTPSSSGYNANYVLAVGHPSPDFYSYCPGVECENAVLPKLGKDGTPDLGDFAAIKASSKLHNGPYVACELLYTCPAVFKWWFNDVPGLNKRIEKTMAFNKIGTNKYHFASTAFWPINTEGYGAAGSANDGINGEFTSHFQTYFKYKGGETLTFSGDDDVWVFFNGYLGVDVGGIHGSWTKSITLDTATAANQLHMYPGGIYPIDMFHAERCHGGSNYEMTLDGFLSMGTSTCTSICGDGIVAGDEECDIAGHINDDISEMLGCISCKKVPKCGNGIIEEGETCDSGYLCKDTYASICTYNATIEANGCESNCTNPYCGNKVLNTDKGEECDRALSYPGQHCLDTCKFSICGDGLVDAEMGEECDLGAANGPNAGCMTTCKLPYCGDGIVTESLGEVCDDGQNDGSYGGCGLGCAFISPYCGDGTIQELNGEECDDGINNSDSAYGGCTTQCKKGWHCGDGEVNGLEECDDGVNNGAYGGCKSDCTLAPYCGDGNIDSGEACDNGAANDDDVYNGCSASCQRNGYCGDGVVNGPEACDDGVNDGSYGGCAANCLSKGPYCGDGKVTAPETCDDGVNDGSYGGCNADCTKAAYCGDGIVNGSEACDPAISSGCTSSCTPEIN